MDNLVQDVRYALRGFAKSPGFTAVALLTLGLGTGANTAVFSFVNALLLRPAPGVVEPSSFVAVYTSDFSSGPYGTSSYPDYLSLKSEATVFEELVAYRSGAAGLLKHGDSVDRVRVMPVTSGFFETIGLRAQHGRLLEPSDFAADAPAVAVIGASLWRRAFGAEATAIGSQVTMNGQPVTIIGVTPQNFTGLNLGVIFEVWTPLNGRSPSDANRGSRSLSIVGRLRPGVGLDQANAQVGAIAERLGLAYPESNLGTLKSPNQARPMLVRRHTRLHPEFREGEEGLVSVIVLGAVMLVLLIACANVANLLLSRATSRGREMAIRLALGAGRQRLVRLMLTESLLLGAGGASLGLLVALWLGDALPSFFPAEQARQLDASIDMRVLAYSIVIGFIASVLFGLAPALQAMRTSAPAVLRGDAGRISDGRSGARVRAGLVAAQVALTVVLLVSAGLLVRSVANALTADLGFATRDAIVANLELPPDRSEPRGRAYYDEVLQQVRALPGVTSATLARALPLASAGRRVFRMDGYVPRPGEDLELHHNTVESQYFETMQIQIVAGRAFEPADNAQGARVVVVNELFARRFFGGNAVGRMITDSSDVRLTIVGVARSVKYRTEVPLVYYPLAQAHAARVVLVAKTEGEPLVLADTIRRTVSQIDRDAAVYGVGTLAGHVAESSAGDRLTATLVACCGALALVLALVGIYGVVSYAVGRRSREIGVRVALGAGPVRILRLVLGEGLRVLVLGIAVGTVGALAAARLLESILYGISPSDGLTFAAVAGSLAVVTVIAAALPARRALAVNPVTVLRQE
jgi:predicted permease